MSLCQQILTTDFRLDAVRRKSHDIGVGHQMDDLFDVYNVAILDPTPHKNKEPAK
ncbi:MAG: hypothetical protein O3A63_14750 [Proteobacteria bacterium]|nr:hypothetical protein [Pseudomonadota bacterium]